jgi:membrane associated rhomboid family serine protease
VNEGCLSCSFCGSLGAPSTSLLAAITRLVKEIKTKRKAAFFIGRFAKGIAAKVTCHSLSSKNLIFTMHFLHSDWHHIGQNSLGIIVLNSFLFYFYRQISFKVFGIIFFVAPIILWLIGRPSNHIGASLLLYGEFSFLLVSGFIRNNPLLLRVALVVILYYGSLVWYLFPVDERISWEGHASGFVIGAVLAYALRKQGPQRKIYQFETEPELPDDENAYWKIPTTDVSNGVEKSETTVSVRYHFKESNKEKDSANS